MSKFSIIAFFIFFLKKYDFAFVCVCFFSEYCGACKDEDLIMLNLSIQKLK